MIYITGFFSFVFIKSENFWYRFWMIKQRNNWSQPTNQPISQATINRYKEKKSEWYWKKSRRNIIESTKWMGGNELCVLFVCVCVSECVCELKIVLSVFNVIDWYVSTYKLSTGWCAEWELKWVCDNKLFTIKLNPILIHRQNTHKRNNTKTHKVHTHTHMSPQSHTTQKKKKKPKATMVDNMQWKQQWIAT